MHRPQWKLLHAYGMLIITSLCAVCSEITIAIELMLLWQIQLLCTIISIDYILRWHRLVLKHNNYANVRWRIMLALVEEWHGYIITVHCKKNGVWFWRKCVTIVATIRKTARKNTRLPQIATHSASKPHIIFYSVYKSIILWSWSSLTQYLAWKMYRYYDSRGCTEERHSPSIDLSSIIIQSHLPSSWYQPRWTMHVYSCGMNMAMHLIYI